MKSIPSNGENTPRTEISIISKRDNQEKSKLTKKNHIKRFSSKLNEKR